MFPVRDNVPSRKLPVVMWGLMASNILIFLSQVGMRDDQLERIVYLFGVVPARYTDPRWASWVGFPPRDYLPFLTSMFLHGGWLHILANMWTLWIFGDNVEDRMGPVRFFIFYLLCGIAASIVHLATNASSTVPAIGASGAIAGVLAAYVAMYPFGRILCIIPIFFYPLFVEVPAVFFIFVWFLSQFLSGTLSLLAPTEGGGIAWWAHVGGFLVGLFIYRLFVVRGPLEPPPLPPDVERMYRGGRW
jgi:membrane associated rhomboid family serine protease